jgi:lipoprotein-releasing system permease protein
MGMTARRIVRIFMLQGLIVGVVGTTVGAAFGLTLAWVENRYGIVRIPPDVYLVDRLPVALDPIDLTTILLASVLIAFAATIYPSIQASRLLPVEAIRHE